MDRPRGRRTQCTLLFILLLLLEGGQAHAQSPARFSLDSAVSADLFRGQNTLDRPNIIVDVTAVARIGNGWLLYVRPWFRQPRNPSWDKEIYQAALQYSRPGRVATRLDLGFIASPIGLGMQDSRPGVNPTIGPHLSYFTPLPVFDPGAPRVSAIASSYPPGGEFTASTDKWDARVALVNSAPTRSYEIHGDANPRSTPVVVTGAGITPKAGLRLGVSFAHGDYATKDELTPASGAGRSVTMAAFEGEYSFAYTKITGEVTHDRFQTATGTATSYAWFLQATQTLTPRLFLAARQEGVSAPTASAGAPTGTRPTLQYSEVTIGCRLSTDFTLRGSVLARKGFTRSDWDQQAGVSLVWARRWW